MNSILAGPLMVIMMLIVRNPRAMGRVTLSKVHLIFGWIATAVMIAASAIFLVFVIADRSDFRAPPNPTECCACR